MTDRDSFDRAVEEIQARILDEEERLYSPIVREEARNPYHLGRWRTRMAGRGCRGAAGTPCGST